MKLGWKLTRIGLGTSLVAGAVTAYVLVNKKEESNTGPVNKDMVNHKGFTGEDLQKREALTKEEFSTTTAEGKFDALLTDLGFSTTLTNNAITLDSLAAALTKAGVKVSDPIDKFGTSFEHKTGGHGAYILASFGDKYHDLTKFVDKLKALTAKPTYKELLAQFPTKFNLRKNANLIFKYAFHDASRETWGLPPIAHQESTAHIDPNRVRIANWNLQNYSGSNSSTTAKRTHAMAAIINDAQVNILGAEEVDNVKGLYDIAKELNTIQNTNSWKVVYSTIAEKAADGKVMGGLGSGEYYGFIYNHDIVQPKPFTDDTIGKLYNNPWKQNDHLPADTPNRKSAFVRPPFAVQFEHKKADNTISDLTAVIAHLDSPGNSMGSSETYHDKNHQNGADKTYESSALDYMSGKSDMGSQEAWEAEQVDSVMKYFDGLNGDDSDMVFMGDTNIKYYKDSKTSTPIIKNPFQSLIDDGFTQLFDPSLNSSATSLSKTATSGTDDRATGRLYVNPYDRIFSKTSQLLPNTQKRYDISTVFSRGVVDPADFYGDAVKNVTKISDHTMVYADYDMNKADTDTSVKNGGYQPDHEVDVNSADYFKLVTQAGLTELQATRVLYYRNLVGKIDDEAELDKIIKYYSAWRHAEDGSTKYTQYVTRTKFVFADSPTVVANEPIRVESGSHITRMHDLPMTKLDINTATTKELIEAFKSNLLDLATLRNIFKVRSTGTQITSYDQIKDTNSPHPELFNGILEFGSSSIVIADPFDVNKASFDYLVETLAGTDAPFGLSEYHIAAIIAKREQDGPLTEAKLRAAIGDYAFGRLPSGIIYSSTPPTSGDAAYEADLASQINIAKATKAQLIKYLGADNGNKVFALIQTYAKTHPLPSDPTKGDLVPDFDYIAANIRYSNYFIDQLKQIFKIDPADNQVTLWVPRATYTFKQLQDEAAKVKLDVSASAVYASPEFKAFCKWVNDHNGPEETVVTSFGHTKTYHIGTLTDSTIKSLISKIQSASSWDSMYNALSDSIKYGRSSAHKAEYTEVYNWLRPTNSTLISLDASTLVPVSGTGTTSGSTTAPASTSTTGKFTFATFMTEALKGYQSLKNFLAAHTTDSKIKAMSDTQLNYAVKAAQTRPADWAHFADAFTTLKAYTGDLPGDGVLTGTTGTKLQRVWDLLIDHA